MTKLSMWTIAFCLLLLGVLFYLAGFFSALYIISASSHSKETGNIPSSLTQKIGTFIDKEDHKASTQPPSSPTPQTAPQQVSSPSITQPSPNGESQTTASPVVPISVPVSQPTQPALKPVQEDTKQQTPSVHSSPSADKGPAGQFFMLQFGEFRTKDSAIKLAQELILRGYQAKVFRSLDQTNKLWFYVRANTYTTRNAAQEAIQHLPPNEKNLLPLIIPSDLNGNMKIIFP